FGGAFDSLAPPDQDTLLQAAADGRLDSGVAALNAARWFEELLTALVELHFSHPLAQVAIGYDGMADAYGMQAVGLAAVATEAERDV
ncbi:MAG: gluconate 2-dehydrogenase subunit 3 family protein, partial [Caulobacteraceae bacterium]